MKQFSTSLVVGLLLFGMVMNVWGYTSEDCLRCHKEGSFASALHIDVKAFESSVHGQTVSCQECHTGVHDDGHKSLRGSGVVNCTQCHDQKNEHGLQARNDSRPQCYSCHTKHSILPKRDSASSVHPNQLTTTCSSCHPLECGKTDYFPWFPSIQVSSHKKQDFSRSYGRENCLGCHQGAAAHGEKGLLNNYDCYKCHIAPDGRGALLGFIHPKADTKRQPATFVAAVLYQVSLVFLFCGGLGFYMKKFSRNRKG
jgi:hypothetical protein